MKRLIIFLLAGLLCIAIMYSCKNDQRNSTHKDVSLASIKNGKLLAIRYCQSCHSLPDPSLLDSKTWEQGVLPNMGPRLGIFFYGSEKYPSSKNDKDVDPNYYPSTPVLGFTEWQNIIDYYVATSPDTLPKQVRPHPTIAGSSLFKVEVPDFRYNAPASVFVKINEIDSLDRIMVSDVLKQNIYFFNRKNEIDDSVHCSGPVVNMDIEKNEMLACNIGVLNPNNGKFGKAQFIEMGSNGKKTEDVVPLFDSLRRPVQVTPVDLNNDGKTDYLVCEFGNLIGSLSWMENLGNNRFTRHVIRALPGAIKAYINDYNHDGSPDIWVLFAQAEEGIFLFTNNGQGVFKTEEVLRFPPVYGSSYFELADFNRDGYPDIVYTCGDNADFSVELKPYHGVYIFLNDQKNHFQQKYFFPINGCYKAIARDFDGDGDLDIATISFFADYKHQPGEGFIYLENKGNFDFQPHSIPGTESGRWLTMDAGDIDGDGRTNLVIGNFSIGPSFVKSKYDWEKGPPFIILKNTGIAK